MIYARAVHFVENQGTAISTEPKKGPVCAPINVDDGKGPFLPGIKRTGNVSRKKIKRLRLASGKRLFSLSSFCSDADHNSKAPVERKVGAGLIEKPASREIHIP